MSKSIIKRLKYINRVQTSILDKDQIEPVDYINVFKDGEVLYGWKEYDMRVGKPLKSDSWKAGYYYNFSFIPKQDELFLGKMITVIQRPKVVKSETQLLIEKTEKANIKLPDIAKNNWGLR